MKDNCNVAFMTDEKCYHIACKSNDLCMPSLRRNPDSAEHIVMVLVKPKDGDSWEEDLQQQSILK